MKTYLRNEDFWRGLFLVLMMFVVLYASWRMDLTQTNQFNQSVDQLSRNTEDLEKLKEDLRRIKKQPKGDSIPESSNLRRYSKDERTASN